MVVLQGVPARIVKRLWRHGHATKSRRARFLDDAVHARLERALRAQADHGLDGVRADRLERSASFYDLANLGPTGAMPLSTGAPTNDHADDITVALGRFDALVERGLRQILGEDRRLRIIGSDLDDAELEHTIAQRSPRVIILDERSALKPTALERLAAARPTTSIVVLAYRPTVAYATRLMALGASCLAKDVSAADILSTVHIAADGRCVFADVDGHLVERSYPSTAVSLTPREIEVMEYLARGQSHREIAHALQLGVETVRTHSAHIRAKLGVRSKRELIGLPIPLDGKATSQ